MLQRPRAPCTAHPGRRAPPRKAGDRETHLGTEGSEHVYEENIKRSPGCGVGTEAAAVVQGPVGQPDLWRQRKGVGEGSGVGGADWLTTQSGWGLTWQRQEGGPGHPAGSDGEPGAGEVQGHNDNGHLRGIQQARAGTMTEPGWADVS